MSIEYITTCDNCKTPFAYETGLAYILFINNKLGRKIVSEIGNKQYRQELTEYLKTDKDFTSPIEKKVYGCPKCNVVYNVDVLENFKPDFTFMCAKCKIPLQELEMDIEDKNNVSYIKFTTPDKKIFKARCTECNKELSGIVDKTICVD